MKEVEEGNPKNINPQEKKKISLFETKSHKLLFKLFFLFCQVYNVLFIEYQISTFKG